MFDDIATIIRDLMRSLGGCITEPPCGDCSYCRADRFMKEKIDMLERRDPESLKERPITVGNREGELNSIQRKI